MALIKCPECKKQISETVQTCPYCGYKFTSEEIDNLKGRAQKKSNFIGFSILIILVFIILKICSGRDKSEIKLTNEPIDNNLNQPLSSISQSECYPYEIIEMQDVSFLNNPQMINRIVIKVDSLPSEQKLKNTAISIWEQGNKNWNVFTVFIYLPKMNTRQSAYGIGEFNSNGLVNFDINESALLGSEWEISNVNKLNNNISLGKVKRYSVNINAIKFDNRKIKIFVNTNFPEGTNLLLSIGRIHFLRGKTNSYIGEIYSKDFLVNQGKIETIVEINDSKWYNEHQRLVMALPDDISPISKISDNITIDILYTSAIDQQTKVINILGPRGENVIGKGVEKHKGGTIGLLTTLKVSKELFMPFEK